MSFSGCAVSNLAGRIEDVLVALRAAREGEAPPVPRAAASAAWRSFFLRLSSAPRLELRGSRDEGLVGLLLWELPITADEVCLLLREREEDRREE